MKIRYKLFIILFSVFPFFLSASVIKLSGFVRDDSTGEALIGANIFESSKLKGTVTDKTGYFNMSVNTPGTILVSYVGYDTKTIHITSISDTLLIVKLESGTSLNEITVEAPIVQKPEAVRLSVRELLLIPSVSSKPDVLKTLQLFPGIQGQSEGLSLLQVRGGDPGQNQYLLDNVSLIYVNHLGGFMSVFNPDMINTVEVYKGNFPVSQGGKISSVIDITQREGDITRHHGSFSIGVTDLSVALEGPVFRKKGSYIVTARKTMTEIPLYFANIVSGNDARIVYGFHDINAKLSWRPDEKNSFHLNLYTGDDYLFSWVKDESTRHTKIWGNWLGSLKWNHVFKNGLFTENILSFNHYRHADKAKYEGNDINDVKYLYKSKERSLVQNYSLRSTWKYRFVDFWNIEFGGQATYLIYEPDYVYISTAAFPEQRILFPAFESAVYLDNKFQLLPGLSFKPSLRLGNYMHKKYNAVHVEPRINLAYSPSVNHHIHLNYMKVTQPSHLIFTQSTILQKEVFLPATKDLQPQVAQQYSIGWNGLFYKKMFELEIGLYYKEMKNLISLKEGYENMVGITHLENKIEKNGKGIASGVEFMLKKNEGKNTGFISYSYSYSTRQFAGINNGRYYDYEYNRPHNLSLSYNRELSKKWNIGLVWVFQSGFKFTPAIGKQYITSTNGEEPEMAIIYGEKNSERLPAYHRLDIGVNHTRQNKTGNTVVWTFSVYNLYNRKNVYNLFYDDNTDVNDIADISKPLQLYSTTFFPIIPSIAYKVYFDYGEGKKKKEKKKRKWLYLE